MEDLGFVKGIEAYRVIEKIAEGYSGDEKYKLEKNGSFYLLRVGDAARSAEKRKEYDRLSLYADQNIHTHKPILFDTADDRFYSIVSWVSGTPIMDIIKKDTSRSYYLLGKKVGIELQKLHAVSRCDSKTNWKEEIEKKSALFLENYHRMDIEFPGSQQAEQYILRNLCLMRNRPQVILHGDFHWNNCVADDSGNVGIIDFSGNTVGDPWYEFGGSLWALEYSESFVNGQIDGYFGTPPDEFWDVFKFYAALYAFEHLTYNNGTPEDIENRIRNASRMLRIFGEVFERNVPGFRK